MSTATNAELVRRYWPEANAHGLLSIVDRYVSPYVISHPPASASPEPLVGLDAYKRFVSEHFYGVFPDLQTIIHDVIADGDLVALRVTATGTHTGSMMGMPPTGRRVTFSGMEQFRVGDGLIVEQWGEFDGVSLMQQLGLMPTSDAVSPRPRRSAHNGQRHAGTREANATTVRSFHEHFNRHDLSRVGELCTHDAVIHHGALALPPTDAVRFADMFFAGFADGRNVIEAILVDDDAVFTRGVFSGTHTGDFMGMPPNGQQVTMSWMTFDRMQDGRIAERWTEQDTLGLLRQVGPAAGAGAGASAASAG